MLAAGEQSYELAFSTYVGVGELCRDIAIDADGDIYLLLED